MLGDTRISHCREVVMRQDMRKWEKEVNQPHDLSPAKDDQEVGANGSDDLLLSTQGALTADPCPKFNGWERKVELVMDSREDSIQRTRGGSPNRERRHYELPLILFFFCWRGDRCGVVCERAWGND